MRYKGGTETFLHPDNLKGAVLRLFQDDREAGIISTVEIDEGVWVVDDIGIAPHNRAQGFGFYLFEAGMSHIQEVGGKILVSDAGNYFSLTEFRPGLFHRIWKAEFEMTVEKGPINWDAWTAHGWSNPFNKLLN